MITGSCYGFQTHASVEIPRLNAPSGEISEPLVVYVEAAARSFGAPLIGTDSATLVWEFGATARLDRLSRTIVLAGAPDPEYLPHPMLVASLAVAAQWEGRVALHAASVAVDGGGLLIVGEKFAGKSTLVGALALAGHYLIADDVSIAKGGFLAAGPRLVDLRPDGAALLGVTERTRSVRSGANRRLSVERGPREVPVRCLVKLAWGDRWSIEPLDARERFALLIEALVLNLAVATPAALTELLALPAWRFTRPRSGSRDLAEGARQIALLATR